MPPFEVHLGDVRTEFRVQMKDQDGTVVDISTATTRQLTFRKPNGTLLVKTATAGAVDVTKTAALGWMHYLSIAGDLDVIGQWRVQGYVVIGAGSWHSDEYRFVVHGNL
jgi:hypothetical protein